MERTTTTVILVLFALVGAGMLLHAVIEARTRIVAQREDCAPAPACEGRGYGAAMCEQDEVVTCLLDERGCMVASRTPCASGCVDAGGNASCR